MNGARRLLAATTPVVLAVGLLACTGDGDDGPLDPVALEGIGDDDATDTDPAADDRIDDGIDDEPDVGEDETGPDDDAPPTAVPGVIDLAVAGTVRVDLVDGQLRLEAIAPAEGWQERARELDGDQIEVSLVREDGGELGLQVELDGDGVRVTWQLEVAPVGAGTIPLGDAGELVVSLSDGALVLEGLRLAAGWEVADEDADDDELDLELRRGDATLEVEVELDDGVLELTLDHDSGRLSAAGA